jgi:hypothetical protein
MFRVLILFCLFSSSLFGLEPQILNKGKVIFKTDFSGADEIKKPRWWIKQHTRWAIKDSVLVGSPATMEYQAEQKKIGKGHLGDIPRIGLGKVPRSYIMSFKFQIDDKKGDGKTPMFEFGHHVSRIFFAESGAQLLTDTDKKVSKVMHMEVKGFKVEPFKWYDVLAEVGAEDLFVQIKDSHGKVTKFYCHYPKFKNSSNNSFGIASTVQGTLKMDDIQFWSSKGLQKDWRQATEGFGE